MLSVVKVLTDIKLIAKEEVKETNKKQSIIIKQYLELT